MTNEVCTVRRITAVKFCIKIHVVRPLGWPDGGSMVFDDADGLVRSKAVRILPEQHTV